MTFLDVAPGPDGKDGVGPAPTWQEITIPALECNLAYWEPFAAYGGMVGKLSDQQWFCDSVELDMVVHEYDCRTNGCSEKAKDHLAYNPNKQALTDYRYSAEVMILTDSAGGAPSDPGAGLYFRGTVAYDVNDGGNQAGGYYLTFRAGSSEVKLLRIQKQGFCASGTSCGTCAAQCSNLEDFTNPEQPPLATFDTNTAGISQINRDEWYKLSVKVEGSTIECFLDEVGLGTVTDDAWSYGTYGLKTYRALAKFRNVQVEVL
jgi:hypothetical protein